MKFTLNWLHNHLIGEVSLAAILETLPRLGFPVAHVQDWSQTLTPFHIVTIQSVKPHPNADRLRLCDVWTGEETLQVVCGAPNVTPDMRTVLAKPGDRIPASGEILKKSVIRGVESNGMLCSYAELGLLASDFGSDSNGIISLPSTLEAGTSVLQALSLNDPLIEIEVTPNRGDMLGVRGIAQELAAAGLGTLRPFSQTNSFSKKEAQFPSFTLAALSGVTAGESPEWLQRDLRAIGLKPVSNLVDITNYLTYDLARPLHVFDADRIQGAIRLTRSLGGEKFEALDGHTYTLPPQALVIVDESGIISLAGIIGGKSTACTPETRNVWLECAFFEPEDIARTGQALGLHTDARARFERGVDPASVLTGLAQGTRLIQEICGGETKEVLHLEKRPFTFKEVTLHPATLSRLIGLSVEPTRIDEILNNLGFSTTRRQDGLHVIPPSWRFDITGEADLVEEIVRLQGYDTIPSTPLPFRPTSSARTPLQQRPSRGSTFLVQRGLQEVMTWSFMAPEKAEWWDPLKPELMLENPLSREWSLMRPSLIPNLLDLALTHQNRSLSWPGFFEVGPQYEGVTASSQRLMITSLLPFTQGIHWSPQRPTDLFTVKAHLLALLDAYGITLFQTLEEGPGWYHPGRQGTLSLKRQTIAFFGELHPQLLKEWGIQGRLGCFELFLDRLPAPPPAFPRPPLPLSPYQPVPLDLAFILEQDIPAEKLLNLIRHTGGTELQQVILFDVFEDVQKVGHGKKSLAFRLFFQSLERTLTDAFIQEKIKQMCDEASKALGAVLRDGVQ